MGNKIRVAILGVGNCASSLVQGVEFYKNAKEDEFVPGLMHVKLGPYHVNDVEFSCGIDVVSGKVGVDVGEAIYSFPNNTIQFAKVGRLGAPVVRGMTHDGIGKYLKEKVKIDKRQTANIVKVLRDTNTDVLVNYLPVGSEEATKWYMEQALTAGVAVINCIPVFIASDHSYWSQRFTDANLPIIGDDIKSQVGATILNRVLARLFVERGVRIDRAYQLNFGGNSDFLNMLERDRLESKKISKTQSVTSQIPYTLDKDNIHVGPSDYVPWLKDRKYCHIVIEGTAFGEVPLKLECKIEVWDSPNSAGIVIDAIRCAKIALDRKVGGPLLGPSSYFMKSPPVQYTDEVARTEVEQFIAN
jgi:myo-inositol-1-phosphate synthase